VTKNVTRSLIVNVPIARAYELWSDFAHFQSFLRHVDQVRVEGRRLRWRVQRGEWDALIARLTPNERGRWHHPESRRPYAVVSMSPTDEGRTKVTLGAEYEIPRGETDDNGIRYEQVLRGFKDYGERFAEQGELDTRSASSQKAAFVVPKLGTDA